MIRSRSFLLAGTTMTAAERSKGRFMRAPDDHPAPAAPAAETPPASDPAPDPAPAPAPDAPMSFDDAFAAETAPPAPEPKPAAPAPAPAPSPEPAPATPVAPPAAPAAPAPAASPTAAEIAAELAKSLPQAPAPAPAPTPAPEPEVAPLYTPEEQTILADYQKDWPDVARAEQLVRRAEYHDLLKYVFTEVNKFIAPTIEQVRMMGNTLHTSELKQLVPDYAPPMEADVNAWIDTQPNYLQSGMKAVMQAGTSEEVADLIGRYRAATGAAPAPAAPAPASAPAAPGTPAPKAPKAPAAVKSELSEAAKQAAASLAPVAGERSQVPVGEDSQDFNAAFAKYAAESM